MFNNIKGDIFMYSYYKRALGCFVIMLTLMLTGGARIATVANDTRLSEAASQQSTRRVNVALNRGTVYDCNGVRLTNRNYTVATVVFPSDTASVPLGEMLEGNDLTAAMKGVRNGQAVTVWGKVPSTKTGCHSFFIPQRYSGTLTHVIGYTASDGHGVTGVEKCFDDILYSGSYIGVSYTVDSRGRMLAGLDYTVYEDDSNSSVTLTIDDRIQTIAEQAMEEVPSGAAVIIEARTGKIRAAVSRPDYDPDNVAASLEDLSSPLINRTTCAYNVGSVFKPCLAAAALKNGMGDYRYTCTGSITVGDVTFKCNNTAGHGELDLEQALAYSCNTYFYTLGQALGADAVYEMAKIFRFGEQLDCNGNMVSQAGSMPTLQKLTTVPAELTNLSIGQGDLLLSPVSVAVMYSAIVNGGEYRLPYIVQSIERNGQFERFEPSLPTVAFSKGIADTLKGYLENALINGTGKAAFTEGVPAGGKTGTAQTGWKQEGRSILNGWFCGFYEGKTENYVIVILKEDVKSGSADCAPVFKTITARMQKFGF